MKEIDYTLIDEYLQGALNEQDAQQFRERLKDDSSFMEAYELRKSMNIFLKNKNRKEGLKKDLELLGNKYFPDEKKSKIIPLKSRWLKIAGAAAAIFILIFAINYFRPEKSLYEQYAVYEPMKMVERNEETIIVQAELAFNSKDYEAAYNYLTEITLTDPDNTLANFYKGICAMELNRTQEALSIFSTLVNSGSLYKPHGKYYLALTYLKAEDMVNCVKTLKEIPESSKFYKQAQELLEKLN